MKEVVPLLSVWMENLVKHIVFVNLNPFLSLKTNLDHDENDKYCFKKLIIGSDPLSCDVLLEPPSISPQHCYVHIQSLIQFFYIIDNYSENGTWLCGRRIEPGVPTRIRESDTLRMGNSSIVYKLQWISKSVFCKLPDPYAPSAPQLEKKEEEVVVVDHQRFENTKTIQKKNDNSRSSNQDDIKIWDFWNIPSSVEEEDDDNGMTNKTRVEVEKYASAQKNDQRIIRMVADTTTLFKQESRKALQLLKCVEGTQLIIPQIVIQALTYLTKPESEFRRVSEVRSALKWIQDCKERKSWWIHIEGSEQQVQIKYMDPRESLDHVLKCALNLKKNNINNNNDDDLLVILSGHLPLKTKAMLEGIICERAQEFSKMLLGLSK